MYNILRINCHLVCWLWIEGELGSVPVLCNPNRPAGTFFQISGAPWEERDREYLEALFLSCSY